MALQRRTIQDFERDYRDRRLLHGAVAKWTREKPDSVALIDAATGREVTWREFDRAAGALAAQLLRLGFRKGDCLAASLPFLLEHIFLEYACFRIGVIHAPLDLRLKAPEVIRCLSLIRARGFAFLGVVRGVDFGELGKAVRLHCPFVEHLIQFAAPAETIEGAIPFATLAAAGETGAGDPGVSENDGAQVIFTTGSTGAPKAALLSHRNIACQNMCLGSAFGFDDETRLLVSLPPSHVGGQAEALMTTLFLGGTAVVMDVFDPAKALAAISKHRANKMGQIPAMYHFQWRLSDYAGYDLSSLDLAIYGGQQVPAEFLHRLSTMAPRIATGLGLTESAGFCTYTAPDADVDDILASIGYDMPAYPMSIREPMHEDGSAGAELPDGEVGQVCFRGPQTFLGYVGDPAATAKTVSSDGYLYTGDMGFRDSRGLHFAGRAKWVIKPAGHQVFPGDVENHFSALADKVSSCGAVGVEHATLSEGIVLFAEKRPGADVTAADLRKHARPMASHMRPLHYVVLEPGAMPVNRAAKTDYIRLSEMAVEEIAALRARGRWDR